MLNASGQGGQAAEVSGALRDLGFAQPTAANDPVYANTRLDCQGQIRFGPAGRAAAAAVWLVAPCTELFQDQRPDDTVDLAIGTEFTELTHSDDIDAMLASLRPDATQPPIPSLLREDPQRAPADANRHRQPLAGAGARASRSSPRCPARPPR